MKREIEREERLPAFDLQLGELELLWARLLELFDSNDKIISSITLSLPSEKLQFDSMAELKDYGKIRGRVTNFSLKASQRGRSVTVKTGGLFNNVPTLKVEAETDIWCAGAVAAAMSIIRPNRVWYSWFIRAPIGLIFILLSLTPYVKSWLFPKMAATPTSLAVVWFVVVVLFGFLSVTKDKLLPAASLTFTKELGFIRRYGGELGLILGLVSLALAIYTWLYPVVA